ncbi:somatomedin-B and thrombospondin type-1 domain-containing protein isoform X2 [Hyla sarda]|uniref:somatomedin-B and thrombospondin type-1 domain-containing protein isoform X2 n=1 Tax=Hyla sarda TaxID=327740 RepID=UPI0024C232CD|nr:somatomedin-B and thrombospondin type-1 domain-containing protein isoform X2 [Hyla sarda]
MALYRALRQLQSYSLALGPGATIAWFACPLATGLTWNTRWHHTMNAEEDAYPTLIPIPEHLRHLARACVVGEWSHWSGCAVQCSPTYRVRRRQVLQEAENGGEPCPNLEEKAGCLEYFTNQGIECGHLHVPAFITTSEYNKERRRRAVPIDWASHTEDLGYCVEFQIESFSPACMREDRPHARWMLYIRDSYTVCVACQHPAMNVRNHRCYGDGTDASKDQILQWQAVGNSKCYGTWRKVREVETCSCPIVHSFIFT